MVLNILDAEDDYIEVSQMKQCLLKLLKISPLCRSSLFIPLFHVISDVVESLNSRVYLGDLECKHVLFLSSF